MSQDSQIAQTDRGLTKRELPRLRFQYGKDERLAFLGHLEVIGTIDRCVRRARLPFSIGNGFARSHAHPVLAGPARRSLVLLRVL